MVSILKFPQIRMYWPSQTRVPSVANVMSINRFEKILQFFHGNDSVKHHPVIHKDHDKLYNVRPVIYSLVYLVLSLSLNYSCNLLDQLPKLVKLHQELQWKPLAAWGHTTTYQINGRNGKQTVDHRNGISLDIKWVSSFSGEVNNDVIYFSPFADVFKSNKGTMFSSIGDSDLTMELRKDIGNGKKSWDFKRHHKDPDIKQE